MLQQNYFDNDGKPVWESQQELPEGYFHRLEVFLALEEESVLEW